MTVAVSPARSRPCFAAIVLEVDVDVGDLVALGRGLEVPFGVGFNCW